MAEKVQFTLNGEAQAYAGEVSGKGSLKLEMDATSLAFALDYKSKRKYRKVSGAGLDFRWSAGRCRRYL
jgi:hypothetical protein